ncbi:response regulator [Candidatus Sumerlaeota bacterium]|nr:response regulator [Candidatus Sumerlaeota bacterium]MBI3736054.1 response regulator [Candidatus Sumerlaeota bacterium]
MSATKVLIVDDNKGYREAFRRNLALRGYEVREAEDSHEALERLQEFEPEVVVTDLAMRHPTEGLDLIRQVRSLKPHLPMIMISAVGTFDEGAEAVRLGAAQVISKSRIDEEMKSLYEAIDRAAKQSAETRALMDKLAALREEAGSDRARAVAAINELLRRGDVAPAVKGEAFDLLTELNREGSDGEPKLPEAGPKDAMEKVESALKNEIPQFDSFDNDTRQNLRTAEFLYQQGDAGSADVDFSRSIGFAYSFAVENEAKIRLRKKLQKFLGDPATIKLVESLLEANRKTISIFYQQHLLRAQQGMENEATMENFHHTFMRILEHGPRYKPDGLKALGIMLICFGRKHTFRKMNKDIEIDNPLDLGGFEGSERVIEFASLLINLQHYRNPYIHPEISEMTKLSKIRETAFLCLNKIAQIE